MYTSLQFPCRCTCHGGKRMLTLFCWLMQQHGRQAVLCSKSKLRLWETELKCVRGHWCAGEGQGRGVGLASASTSSLQHVHEEGMNGSSGFAHHPAQVRTASVADSADEAAQPSGELFNFVMPACICCRNHDHLPTCPCVHPPGCTSCCFFASPARSKSHKFFHFWKDFLHAGHGDAVMDI